VGVGAGSVAAGLGVGVVLAAGVGVVVVSGVPVHPTAVAITTPATITARVTRPCIRMPGRYRFSAAGWDGFIRSVDGAYTVMPAWVPRCSLTR
jgi:hypothetical protein